MNALFLRQGSEKQEFIPLDPQHVKLYACGPTVYGPIHLGNARPVVVCDILYRLLKDIFPKVTYVRNLTDLDDKITRVSSQRGISALQLTQEMIHRFHQDTQSLGVLTPDHEPCATEHIPDMIQIIQTLLDKGFAYQAQGHVLFEVAKYADYGQLSGISLDQMMAGARVEVAPYKRSPYDFVLWKPGQKRQEVWSSPFGPGRPGWHIECSAMSQKYLGDVFDIHAGGMDLLFPHHENERAQNCGALGVQEFVRYWVHNGMLVMNGQKMSKSLGNVVTLYDTLTLFPACVIRWALLSTHYRQTLDWTETLLQQTEACVKEVASVLEPFSQIPAQGEVDPEVMTFLKDDLNTPLALGRLYQWANALRSESFQKQEKEIPSLKRTCEFLLGSVPSLRPLQVLSEEEIEMQLSKRREARETKNYALSDQIRDYLLQHHVILSDTKEKTSWQYEKILK